MHCDDALAPFCGPDDLCHDGNEGDPCSGDGECNDALAPYCIPSDDLCHDGTAGDPCQNNSDCINNCAAGNICN